MDNMQIIHQNSKVKHWTDNLTRQQGDNMQKLFIWTVDTEQTVLHRDNMQTLFI